MKIVKWFILLAFALPLAVSGQDSILRNWSLNGYLTNMQSFMFQNFDGDWTSDNLIHNRLNFNWHTKSNSLNTELEIRNRFFSGDMVKYYTGYDKMIDTDNGIIKLSDNLSNGKSYLLNSKIDRAYIDFTKSKFQIRVGRQRINWGQCFTWNPNDIFNAYSFFDFDYTEKPGSDAVRLQYYKTETSTIEIAAKADSNKKVTSAMLYRFNKWNYDIQFLGGILEERDWVIGTGWSGNIKGTGFRGEVSYFRPKKDFQHSKGILVASVGSDYSFPNSFMLQFEVLYNQNSNTQIKSFTDYYNMNLSAENLSFTKVSMMLQGSYPVTPLFNVSLAGMYFPKLNGFFVGPTLTYSVSNNVDFSLVTQSFVGKLGGVNEHFNLAFLRLKWNF